MRGETSVAILCGGVQCAPNLTFHPCYDFLPFSINWLCRCGKGTGTNVCAAGKSLQNLAFIKTFVVYYAAYHQVVENLYDPDREHRPWIVTPRRSVRPRW